MHIRSERDQLREEYWPTIDKERLLNRIERLMRFDDMVTPEKPRCHQVILDCIEFVDEVGRRNASVIYNSSASNPIKPMIKVMTATVFWIWSLPLFCRLLQGTAEHEFLFIDPRLPDTAEDHSVKKAIFQLLECYGFDVNPTVSTTHDIAIHLETFRDMPRVRYENQGPYVTEELNHLFQADIEASPRVVDIINQYAMESAIAAPAFDPPAAPLAPGIIRRELEAKHEAKRAPMQEEKSLVSIGTLVGSNYIVFFKPITETDRLSAVYTKLHDYISSSQKDFSTIVAVINIWLRAAILYLKKICEFQQSEKSKIESLGGSEVAAFQENRLGLANLLGNIEYELVNFIDLPIIDKPVHAVKQIKDIFQMIESHPQCPELLKVQAAQLIKLAEIVLDPKANSSRAALR